MSFSVICAIGLSTDIAYGASSTVLFPKPLHLVRIIEDPLATRGTSTVHEYCAGNQIITVDGSRVAIADYDKQQLTEIDREAGTYSITPFAEIAKAHAKAPRAAKTPRSESAVANAETWRATQMGIRAASASGRSLESWQLVRESEKEKATIDVGIDRRIALSRDAVEVLVGASYPHTRRDEHDALLRAAGGPQAENRRQPVANSVTPATPAPYGLPAEQVFTFESEGERIAIRNTVREVSEELPPAELLLIPPGSQLVESRTARMARELREADQLKIQTPQSRP